MASSEEEKASYEEGLLLLSKEPLAESSGKLIARLLEINCTETLIGYSRDWISLFPNDRAAIRIVAEWLKASPSAESIAQASHYLQQTSICDYLAPVIRAVYQTDPDPILKDLVAELLEKAPKGRAWEYIMGFPESGMLNLALRWVDLNMDNPKLAVLGAVADNKLPDFIEKLLEWLAKTGRESRYATLYLAYLLESARSYHKPFIPKLAEFARAWVLERPEESDAGHLLSELVLATESAADIELAKDWYLKNMSSNKAWILLNSLLQESLWQNNKADEFAVRQAKIRLSAQAPTDRSSRLVCSLLKAHHDQETIAIAKSVYNLDDKRSWWMSSILIDLLLLAPDDEVIEHATRKLDNYDIKGRAEGKLIHALLSAAPGNSTALRSAHLWLKEYDPNHPSAASCAQQIRALM